MNYHHIEVKINTNHKPSYFTGSMLRGALGYALKKVTCINPSYKCEGCFSSSSCMYFDFYEKKDAFHKYRFDIELGSGKFDFAVYLFNDSCDKVAYFLSAIEMVLTKTGLTKHNYLFEDISIYLNGKVAYKKGAFTSLDTEAKTFKVDSFCPNVKVKLLTPLRIKKNNKFLRDDIELEDLLRSIYQKEQEFATGKKAFKLNYEPSQTTSVKALSHKSLVRTSSRQNNKRMNMDGIVGEIAILGIDKRSYELLKLGEVIGVGKQTVMGLGKIEVEDLG